MTFFLYVIAAGVLVTALGLFVLIAGTMAEWILLAPSFPARLRRFAFAALSGLFFSGLLRVFV